MQGHIELTEEMLEYWMNEDPDLLQLEKEELRTTFRDELPEYSRTGRQLMLNFIKMAGY